jgi:hypothetical protein
MSKILRRQFLAGATGLASAAMVSGAPLASTGDESFMNNVPDPILSGKELPTFKFALEKSQGKVIGESYGKEATVVQLPISKGIAGVSMRLEPGACESFTGTLQRQSGRSSYRDVCEQRSSIRRAMRRPTTLTRATFGTFPAATPTCCNVSATSLVILF